MQGYSLRMPMPSRKVKTSLLRTSKTLQAFKRVLADILLKILLFWGYFEKKSCFYHNISKSMTHYDRDGGGGMANYDVWQWQGGIWKTWILDTMLKFRQETHKKVEVLAWKYKNSTILFWIWINSDWFHHSKLLNYFSTLLKSCLKNIRKMK